MLDLTTALLVRNPPMERLVTLIDYISAISSEIIIVDTGSYPQDIRRMEALNRHPFSLPRVLVAQRRWENDFAQARNEGLSLATRKWTLVLDPDELPSLAMTEHIRKVVTEDGTNALGYLYFSRNYFDGTLDPEQEFHWHVRLFRTGRGRFYRSLDELVALDEKPEHLTRGTHTLPKAPRNAYLIHSKSGQAIGESEKLYEEMRNG